MNKNLISLLFLNIRGVYFKMLTAVVAMNYLYALVIGSFCMYKQNGSSHHYCDPFYKTKYKMANIFGRVIFSMICLWLLWFNLEIGKK